MADSPATELLPVLPIEDLPYAMEVTNDSKFPMSQKGVAMKILGEQIADFAREAAAQDVQRAVDAADAAEAASSVAVKKAAEAESSARSAQQYSGKPPVIREGRWWIWDADAQEYLDTGEAVRGNLMYAAFRLDPLTGNLYMYTDDEYAGPQFRLNGNHLEVLINA